MSKIVITGGHITPALAVIDELAKRKDIELIFFGRKYATEGNKALSWEYKIISGKRIKFYSLTAGRFQRKFTRHTIPALLKIPVGFIQSFLYLLATRPSVVVSFGGYLSLPTIFSAWLIGIPSVTHEQSAVPGLANKINAFFVEKIYVSWPETKKFFPKDKADAIGNPVRVDIFKLRSANKKISTFLKNPKRIVYITGGNQGSHFLNKLVLESRKSLSSFNIIHQVGSTNFDGDLDKAKVVKADNYLALDYLDSQTVGSVINRADIVVSRSGANTVWELATLAKPAILVPLAVSAGNEQYLNAKVLENAGSAIILDQHSLNNQVFKNAIEKMGSKLDQYDKAANKLAKSIPSGSAQLLAREILRYT